MSTALMVERMTEASPRSKARIAGVFYLLSFVTGTVALLARGSWGLAAVVMAVACYIGVTLLFYEIFRPVNKGVSLLAAVVSLLGCAIEPLGLLHSALSGISPLVFFGFYCLLIGYLIFKSIFLPRFLAIAMAVAGLGWLTFLSPSLAHSLSPYIFFPGILGEGLLTVWLLTIGVNDKRWKEQAGVTGE
jgi:hypothetical protein